MDLLRRRAAFVVVAALTVVAAPAVASSASAVTAARSAKPAESAKSAHCAGTGTEAGAPVVHTDAAAGVTQVRSTFVDRSRGTPALGSRAATDCRTLPVIVRVPAGAVTARPLVLLVHGADGDPTDLAALADVWAQAGYVVVQPHFPTNRKQTSGKALGADLVQQTKDARFVLDQVLDRATSSTPGPLQGQVDGQHIGAAGMSLGGQTVYGLISHTCCHDDRIGAAVVMAGVHDPFPAGEYVRQKLPVLLVQGDADIGYHHSRDTYPQLASPKWFVTLKGERHAPPFEVPRNSPAAGIVDATTVAFWDLTLRGDTSGTARIEAAVRDSGGRATLQEDLTP